MMTTVFDGTGYVLGDIGLAILISLSAMITYARIAFETGPRKMPIPRTIIALGFTLLAIRFWTALYFNADVAVPPLSMVSMAMICGGYCTVQLRAINRSLLLARVNLVCLRDPDHQCQREDRLQDALLNTRKDSK